MKIIILSNGPGLKEIVNYTVILQNGFQTQSLIKTYLLK